MRYCATAYQKKLPTSQSPDVLTGANKPSKRGMNPSVYWNLSNWKQQL
jgi:hypothetical protein